MTTSEEFRARMSELHAEVDDMAEKAADKFVGWVGDEHKSLRDDLVERYTETFAFWVEERKRRTA